MTTEELLLFEHDRTDAGLTRSVRAWSSLLRGLQVAPRLERELRPQRLDAALKEGGAR